MGQPAIRNQILDDLEKLPAELQRRVQEIVHAMVLSAQDPSAPHEVLRFTVDDPLTAPRPPRHSELRHDAPPEEILDEIRLLIADGQILLARRLAVEAADRFPDHEEIRQARHVLNDGKAAVGSRGPEPSTNEEFEWLRNPPEWARGKWVALVGNEAVATADELSELVASLKTMKLPKQPLVHRIE